MARFILKTGTAPGHINPTLPICRKIIENGHEIVWMSGQTNRDKIENTGARFHPLPVEIDPGEKKVYEFYPELAGLQGIKQIKWYIKHMFLDGAVHVVKTLDGVLKSFKADALIGDTVSFGLFFLAERRRLPSAMISLLPLSLTSRDTAPFGLGLPPGARFTTRIRNTVLNYLSHHILFKDVNRHADQIRARLGLPVFKRPFLRQLFELPSIIMQISTPAFEYPRSDQPDTLKFIGPVVNAIDPLYVPPLWWDDLKKNHRKVVLINQGTVATNLNDLIIPAVRGLKNDDYLVVAVPVKPGEIGDLPSHVKGEPFIPFANLLPHVDIMVTNGGYGGTQLALAHGIPLVVAGQTDDKMEVAARVQWSGAGVNLGKQRVSPEDIRDGVRAVLNNPLYKKNAARIQADFSKYDAPARACELLEALIANPETGRGTNSNQR